MKQLEPRGEAKTIVLNGWGARLSGMVNVSELLFKHRNVD